MTNLSRPAPAFQHERRGFAPLSHGFTGGSRFLTRNDTQLVTDAGPDAGAIAIPLPPTPFVRIHRVTGTAKVPGGQCEPDPQKSGCAVLPQLGGVSLGPLALLGACVLSLAWRRARRAGL